MQKKVLSLVFAFMLIGTISQIIPKKASAQTLEKVIVTDSITIKIDPNSSSIDYELPISDAIAMKNESNGIVQMQISSIEPIGDSPAVVGHGKFSNEEWMNLTRSQTANNIAFGIVPSASSGWDGPTAESWIIPGDKSTIGVIGEYSNVHYKLKAKYGLSYEHGTTLSYKINYELTYIKAPTIVVTGVSLNNNNPKPGDTLSGTPLPGDATVDYEWFVNGSRKSTSSTYMVQSSDAGYAVTLKVTGKNKYSGSASASSNKVTIPVTGLRLNTTSPNVGSTLYPTVTPSGATVDYEWRVNGSLRSTSSSYTVQSSDVGYTVSLKVTGNGIYSGTATATTSAVTDPIISITGVSINGSPYPDVRDGRWPQYDWYSPVSANVYPSNANVTYSWYIDGSYYGSGVSFNPPKGSGGKTLTVEAAGYGGYAGTVSSSKTIGRWNPSYLTFHISPKPGYRINVGVRPNFCTGSYNWYLNGRHVGSGVTSPYLSTGDIGSYLRVEGTYYGDFQGSISHEEKVER